MLVLLFVLIGLAHGASVSNGPMDCRIPSLLENMKCFSQLVNFITNTVLITFKDIDKAKDFEKSCNDFQHCYESLQCRQDDPSVMDLTRKVQTYCDGLMYMSTDFASCNQKLDQKNSECWDRYFPNPGIACSNLFGRNNCVKQEIIDTCGQQYWTGFRDNVIDMVQVGYQNCNFDQYRNL